MPYTTRTGIDLSDIDVLIFANKNVGLKDLEALKVFANRMS